jgi:hypothetical protein
MGYSALNYRRFGSIVQVGFVPNPPRLSGRLRDGRFSLRPATPSPADGVRGGMHLATNLVVVIAIIAVFVALLLGLGNMLRGGSANTSQMIMRWRVGLQFVAILIILAVLYFRG